MQYTSSFVDLFFVFFGGYLVSYFFQSDLLLTCAIFSGFMVFNKLFNNSLYGFRDVLRKPNTNVHSIMFLGVPVVDFMIAFMGAYALSYYWQTDLLMTYLGSLVLGEFLHYIFGVNTRFFNYIGIQFKEQSEEKIKKKE